MTTTKPTHATPRPKPSIRAGAPSKPITAPKPPKPPTVPWPKPRVTDAARARRERDLDLLIARVRPAMAAFDDFALANGIDQRALLTSKAAAIWSGSAATATTTPRAWIF